MPLVLHSDGAAKNKKIYIIFKLYSLNESKQKDPRLYLTIF